MNTIFTVFAGVIIASSFAHAKTSKAPAIKIELHADRMLTQGQTPQVPWSGWWWPTNSGGVSKRWISPNELSPIEKYDKAFSAGGSPATEWVKTRTKLNADRSLTGRLGFSWYGECDAYSIAASVEPEPRHAVMQNGVCFTSGDLKALISHAYLGNLYGLGKKSAGGIKPALHPMAFHLMVTTTIGSLGRPMVMDFGSSHSVFNHPVFRFQSKMRNVQLHHFPQETGQLPAVGTARIVHVTTYLDRIEYKKPAVKADGRAYYKRVKVGYYLFLDERGRVFGEGVWEPGLQDRPDMIAEVARGPKPSPSGNPHMSYLAVRNLVERSSRAPAPECEVAQ